MSNENVIGKFKLHSDYNKDYSMAMSEFIGK